MNESELLHKLEAEFKELGLPFKVKPINRIQMATIDMIYSPYGDDVAWEVEISTECSQEDIHYFTEQIFKIDNVISNPRIDIVDSMKHMFDSDESAYNFHEPLNGFYSTIYKLSTALVLTNEYVDGFIGLLRDVTEPLRLKRYEQQFDSQVEDHLSEPKYNEDNGHK